MRDALIEIACPKLDSIDKLAVIPELGGKLAEWHSKQLLRIVANAMRRDLAKWRDGELFAYRNSCPHTGSPLDWVEHQFLDLDGALIQCATHDARFLIDTRECVFGPCPQCDDENNTLNDGCATDCTTEEG